MPADSVPIIPRKAEADHPPLSRRWRHFVRVVVRCLHCPMSPLEEAVMTRGQSVAPRGGHRLHKDIIRKVLVTVEYVLSM